MTTNQAYKPSEGKREEFRKYLEKAGIMDALTKVLVNLYEEIDKPEDALTYIIDKLSLQAGLETHKQLNEKLEELTSQNKTLETELETLKKADESPLEMTEGVEGEASGEAPAEVPVAEDAAPPEPAQGGTPDQSSGTDPTHAPSAGPDAEQDGNAANNPPEEAAQ